MQYKPVSPIVLAAALSACSAQPQLLNSERIEQRFGSYGVAVLQQEGSTRRSSLYSVDNGTRICRTYAVVEFADTVAGDVAPAHQAVLAGESIGTTLETAGWTLHKHTIHIGKLQVPDAQHTIARLMQLASPTILGMHIYRLLLEKDGQVIHYATIIESHHPEYLVEADLIGLYSQDLSTQLAPAEVEALINRVLE